MFSVSWEHFLNAWMFFGRVSLLFPCLFVSCLPLFIPKPRAVKWFGFVLMKKREKEWFDWLLMCVINSVMKSRPEHAVDHPPM